MRSYKSATSTTRRESIRRMISTHALVQERNAGSGTGAGSGLISTHALVQERNSIAPQGRVCNPYFNSCARTRAQPLLVALGRTDLHFNSCARTRAQRSLILSLRALGCEFQLMRSYKSATQHPRLLRGPLHHFNSCARTRAQLRLPASL